MPFGIRQDEIVIVDRLTGTTAHLFPNELKGDLIARHRAGDGVDISDARGDHHYPSAAVLGLHFQTAPNYQNAAVQLWQDKYGIGRAGEPGAARLYLVDPENPDEAYPIRSSWVTSGADFRTLAGRLVEGTLLFGEVVDANGLPRNVQNLEVGAHVATWHHTGTRVEIITERRAGVPGLTPVAGQGARDFIGLEDMNADARRAGA